MDPGEEHPDTLPDPLSDSGRTEDRLRDHLGGNTAATRRLFFDLDRYVREEVLRHRLWPAVRSELDDVGDVVGPLWEALFRRESLHGFIDRGRGSLRAWLRTCVDMHMRETLRTLKAERRGGGARHEHFVASNSSSPGVPEPASPDPGQSTMVSLREFDERCLRALSAEEAEVWRLRSVEGLEFAVLAERLGVTESSARGRFHRAKRKLESLGILVDPEADEGGET